MIYRGDGISLAAVFIHFFFHQFSSPDPAPDFLRPVLHLFNGHFAPMSPRTICISASFHF